MDAMTVMSIVATRIAAVGTAVLLAPAPAAAQDHAIRGTWIVQVRLLTACTSGNPLPPFWSVVTFTADGGVSGSTLNSAFAPGQRGPDHGQWAAAPGGGVTASTLALLSFTTPASPPQSPGFQAGARRIDQTIALSGRDSFTSTARVTFVDLAGTVYRQGCAVATAWRFQ
jgi:hypothetical protein